MFGTSKHCVHRLSSAQMAIHIVLPFCMLREPLFHRHLDSTRHTIFFVSFSPKNNPMVLSSAFLGENVITFYWQKPSWLYFFRFREEMWTGVQELKVSLLWTWRQNRDKLEIAILLRNREQQRNGIYAINSKTAQNCFQLIVSSCFPILSPAPCWPSFWLKRRKCRKKKMKLLGKNLFF